ncbi:MAG: transposase [Deltaproteobacteria bacterium]|nr:transposase [Deltaproteobacteria bacterium]
MARRSHRRPQGLRTLGPWLPFSLLIVWPFSWHVLVVLDHYSRAVVAIAVFLKAPATTDIVAVLERAAKTAGKKPRYIVTDRGPQFRDEYRDWCETNGIDPRFGAIGQHGSIAVIERFILTLKTEWTRRVLLPLWQRPFEAALLAYVRWYNTARPHQTLGGKTPEEMMTGKRTAEPRIEVRPKYPISRRGPKAVRKTRVKGPIELVVSHPEGAPGLPMIKLRRAA